MPWTSISRRTLLGSAAAGAVAVSGSGALAAANAALPLPGCGHGGKHAAFAKKLAVFLDKPQVSSTRKNAALRTASCPDCGVRLHPAQI